MHSNRFSRGAFGSGAWRWPALFAALIAFFSLGRLTGAAQKPEDLVKLKDVETERLELRGADGKLAASLARGSKGEPVLTFFDPGNQPRLMIGLDPKGTPSIFFLSETHIPRLSVTLDPDGGEPAINLYDDRGGSQIHLGITKGFGPGLTIGKVGQSRVSIGAAPDGSSSIHLWDKKNKPRITLSVLNDEPLLILQDEQGASRAVWRLMADGSPVLSLHDPRAKPRLVVRTDGGGKPSIQFIDADNKVAREIK